MPRSKGNPSTNGRAPERGDPTRGEVAEPPVRLVMAMTLLGVLVGAMIAPSGTDGAGVGDATRMLPDDPVPTRADDAAPGDATAARAGNRPS